MKLKSYPWARYSKKAELRIDAPYCMGVFTEEDAKARDLFLARGSEGSLEEGNRCDFYLLVDKTDGVIIDARFQAFGNTALICAAEIACELFIGKNYDQASRISSDLIDKHVRNKSDEEAFPEESNPHLNLVVDAFEKATEECRGIPLQENYVAPPIMGHEIEIVEGGYPGFMELSQKQKIAVIEEVLTREVRPYIALDQGGVDVKGLTDDKEVIISYSGTCTSCHSATGATLSYIQDILKAKVHPDLIVTPTFD